MTLYVLVFLAGGVAFAIFQHFHRESLDADVTSCAACGQPGRWVVGQVCSEEILHRVRRTLSFCNACADGLWFSARQRHFYWDPDDTVHSIYIPGPTAAELGMILEGKETE